MRFEPPLLGGHLIRRYKRFLADVELDSGEQTTVYCPNTGAMTGCDIPGSRVWLSVASNPARKYPLTWELVHPPAGPIIGINTGLTNHLVAEAIDLGLIPALRCAHYQREVAVADGRMDFMLDPGLPTQRLLEVKNVTAAASDGVAQFPDARSVRAVKHLRHLREHATRGAAVLLFCVQRDDVDRVVPATAIDPEFARELALAHDQGVSLLAYRWRVAARETVLDRAVEVRLDRSGENQGQPKSGSKRL